MRVGLLDTLYRIERTKGESGIQQFDSVIGSIVVQLLLYSYS